jgi:TctA family transporter
LISIGAISGFDIVFSLILLYSVGKARIGVLEVAGHFFNFDLHLLILSLLLVMMVGLFSYFIALRLGKVMVSYMSKINYRALSIAVIFGVSIASFYFDGLAGLFFLFAAAGIGTLADKLRTRMTHCMGSLIIPVLIYYLV